MIAWLGILMHSSGIRQEKADFNPNERTDDVVAGWRK